MKIIMTSLTIYNQNTIKKGGVFMNYIIIILTILGFLFIFLGLLNYIKLLKNFDIIYKNIEFSKKKYLGSFIFIILIAFLILYLIYLNHIIFVDEEHDYFINFTAFLLFLGGIFVYTVILLIKSLSSSLEIFHIQMIRTLIKYITFKDRYTSRHSVHVSDLVKVLWEKLPIKMKEQTSKNDLIQAALLHDIGKITIPLSILNKKEPLSVEEYEKMKQHAANCTIILNNFSSLKKIIPWIKYHHERLDGSGYNGLRAKEIPLESKVIAVADTYSALTTDRVYKKSISHKEAIKILQESSGFKLDKDIVDSFIKIKKSSLERINFKLNIDFDKQ